MVNKQFFNKKMRFSTADADVLPGSLSFIEETLGEAGVDRSFVLRTVLLAEEVIAQLLLHASSGSALRVQVRRFLGDYSVTLRAEGERFELFGDAEPGIFPGSRETAGAAGSEEAESLSSDTEAGAPSLYKEAEAPSLHEEAESLSPDTEAGAPSPDEEVQQAIRAILLKSQEDRLRYSYINGANHVRILAGQGKRSVMLQTVAALALGILFGLLLRFAFPDLLSDRLMSWLLEPVRTMFMNALRIVIGPVIFFSIVSCISQFQDLSKLGRIGAKVMGFYLMTTVMAILLSLSLATLFRPGEPGFALGLEGGAVQAVQTAANTEVDTSILHTIVNIVPSNFVSPFLQADTLQIIFLAVLCGTAVGMIGEYSTILKDFFEACNALFLTITTMICSLIPAAVFCSVTLMVVQTGGSSFLALLGYTGTHVLAIGGMLLVYGLLILVFGRLNPITFYQKSREGMLTALMLSSTSAAMPVNMRICTEKLGISPMVSSFSIPLGATVNMDGTSIFLTGAAIFLSRAYGVPLPAAGLASLAVTIVLLSLGCPAVPGAGLVCLGIVLTHLHVPVEAMGLLMGIYPFLDMLNTMSNATGDMAASLVVARSEGLLDLETYRRKM